MIRVLIVDDHAVVRSGLASAFSIANFEVVGSAATVAEALAQIAHTNPDVVVLDLNLPDGSGKCIGTGNRSRFEQLFRRLDRNTGLGRL